MTARQKIPQGGIFKDAPPMLLRQLADTHGTALLRKATEVRESQG